MVSSRGKEGVALLVVVIVILAALSVAVIAKNDSDNRNNPNGILGTYKVVDYIQYGGEGSSVNWDWFTPQTHEYDGEKIRIDSYNNGTIRATCMLKGEEFKIIGYYDPDTKAFGYTSYYDYVPQEASKEKQKVIDWLQGSIIGDMMYLQGYTMSTEKVADPLIYTFKFTFIKENSKAYQPLKFEKALTSTMYSSKTTAMVSLGDYSLEDEKGYPYSFELAVEDYRGNGIYDLTETTIKGDGTRTPNKVTATTIYQSAERTVLRAIGYYGEKDYNICWYVIEGKHMYCLFDSNYYSKNYEDVKGSCVTLYSTDKDDKWTLPAAYDLSEKAYSGELTYDSSFFPTVNEKNPIVVVKQGENTNVAVTLGQTHINVIPGVNALVFFIEYESGGIDYYGDMMGKILNNGDLYISGFVYGENGEALYVHGTLKLAE